MKIWPLVLIINSIIFSSLQVNSQIDNNQAGTIQIIKDPRIDTLLQKHIAINKTISTIEGYRIQIFFDAGNYSRRNALDVKERFLEFYPDMEVYITFREPYYRVRVGDFLSRMDAEGFLNEIKNDYPNAFAIKDNVIPFKRIDTETEEALKDRERNRSSIIKD